ncbi:MAG: glycosyltransferase family 4 protein [Candidatus Levyibacteriota bacterium]|nr:MAG: glycosyltransferase family 4 protein [Candidatus Levybacteria bacterium]
MKVLVVSSFLPYPLFSGGHVRLYSILKELYNKGYELTLTCEKRSYQTDSDIKEMEKICKKVVAVSRQKQWSVKNILQSGFSSYPFLLIGHTQKEFQQEIKNILSKEKFDLIHIETFYVMQNLPAISTPTVLVEHNIEYLVYQRYVQNVSVLLRPLLMLDILKMKYWEKYFWKKATKLVAVSDEEKKLMSRDDVMVVPNGVDLQRFKINDLRFKNKKENTILFIGDFKWMQNRDAVEWILKEIWPMINLKLKTKNLKLKLWIVGRKIPESIKKLTNDSDVIFDENAPKETSEIFNKADLLLAPIRIGGGTSFKILEAMASGVPVVTTSLGIEGINAENNKETIIANTTENIANDVVSLLENSEKYQMIVKNARALIEEKYDWKKIVKKLEAVYGSAVGDKHD